MKIVVAGGVAKAGVELDVSGAEVELVGVFNGVGIKTDQGHFGVCQRDGGIEVLLNGHVVWSSVHGQPSAVEVARVDKKKTMGAQDDCG